MPSLEGVRRVTDLLGELARLVDRLLRLRLVPVEARLLGYTLTIGFELVGGDVRLFGRPVSEAGPAHADALGGRRERPERDAAARRPVEPSLLDRVRP